MTPAQVAINWLIQRPSVTAGSLAPVLKPITDGRLADIIVVGVGTIEKAIDRVGKGGRMGLVGIGQKEMRMGGRIGPVSSRLPPRLLDRPCPDAHASAFENSTCHIPTQPYSTNL